MKWYGVPASLLLVAAMLCAGQSSSPQSTSPHTPVLVELFTSEGCSSCPPADELLTRLDQQQPVAGAEIIAMSEHVDYWNSLGWKDPFSAASFTDRQNGYRKTFGNSDIYTPQMIVDGQAQFIGNDRAQAVEAVAGAIRKPKLPISINVMAADASSARVHVQLNIPSDNARPEAADVYLVIVENNLSSNVARGENKGRKLTHVAVARSLDVIGHIASDRPFSTESVMRISRDWKRENLQAVAFVQTNKTRRIIALIRTSL